MSASGIETFLRFASQLALLQPRLVREWGVFIILECGPPMHNDPLPQILSMKCNYCTAGAEYKAVISSSLFLINLSTLQKISGLWGKFLNWLREACFVWRCDNSNKLSRQDTSEYSVFVHCADEERVSVGALLLRFSRGGVNFRQTFAHLGIHLSPDWLIKLGLCCEKCVMLPWQVC